MNWKVTIPIAVVVGIAAFVLGRLVEDRLPSTVDPGKEERDALYTKGQLLLMLDSAKSHWTDSTNAAIAHMLDTLPPVFTYYHQAHEEALSLPNARLWRFMGQWPDTSITR